MKHHSMSRKEKKIVKGSETRYPGSNIKSTWSSTSLRSPVYPTLLSIYLHRSSLFPHLSHILPSLPVVVGWLFQRKGPRSYVIAVVSIWTFLPHLPSSGSGNEDPGWSGHSNPLPLPSLQQSCPRHKLSGRREISSACQSGSPVRLWLNSIKWKWAKNFWNWTKWATFSSGQERCL